MSAVGGDGALARDICGIFTDEIGGYGYNLEQGLAGGDVEAARLAAHAVKNMAGNVCAESMRLVALEIETACREGNAEKAAVLLPALKARIGEVCDCLAAHAWPGG